MARGKGRSGRRYVRDAKGRFASKGYVGQTGGRGARLKSAGKKREGGGEKTKITATSSKGTLKARPRSAGQKYAARIQAGKDLKRSQSVAKQKKFLAQTQKKLDAAPLAQSSARQAAKTGAAKPARRKALPKDGTDITREIGRAKGNKRIKNLNQQIKEAGPNAAGLRLEKLRVQTRMTNKPRQRMQPTAKQSAKEASRNDAIRKRSAELRAQSGRLQRNQANIQRLKAQSPKPGSRRLSSSQIKRQNRADTAKDIYSAPSAKRRAQIVRNQAGIARTERAKNNSMRLRSDRLAEAKATGLPMIKVTKPKKSDYDMKMKKAPKGRRR